MSYKKFALLVAFLFTLGYWYFNHGWEIRNYPAVQGTTIVAFGDSLVEGIGATQGNGFVSIVSRKLQVPIVNAGVKGNTTVHGLERLERDVLSKDPKVVLVLLGGNDFIRRIPKEETFRNLQTIVNRIHEKGAIVVLLGIRGGVLKDSYRADFDEFAKRNKVAYVPNVLGGLLGDKDVMADAVHPNDAGYAVIAERVAPVLEDVLK